MKCPHCGFVTPPRNLDQNALFHVWMRVLADELGYASMEEAKTAIKQYILGNRMAADRPAGTRPGNEFSTSKMTKHQMAEFMAKVKIWALTDLNIALPYTNEEGYAQMMQHYSK